MGSEDKKYECQEVVNATVVNNEPSLDKVKLFNRGWFDRKDPSERIGKYLGCFSLYQIYNDIENVGEIKENLYGSLKKNITENTPDYIKTNVVEFADSKNEHIEGKRKYIIVERETPRKTQLKVLIRFLEQGDKLYLGIDSYVLGRFSLWDFVKRLLMTYFVITVLNIINIPIFFIATFLGKFALFNLYAIFFNIFIFIFMWIDVIRGFLHHKRFFLAFRQCFNKFPDTESFNIDDIFMFFKGILPIVVSTIKEVFKDNNIDYNTLDDFMVSITNINNMQTINNSAPNQGVQGMNYHGTVKTKN